MPPIQWMSDGLAAYTPKQHQERIYDLSWLVHGRRQLADIEDFLPMNESRSSMPLPRSIGTRSIARNNTSHPS